MFYPFVKVMVAIFGAAFLLALGYEIYDHIWFKFVKKPKDDKVYKKQVFEIKKRILRNEEKERQWYV